MYVHKVHIHVSGYFSRTEVILIIALKSAEILFNDNLGIIFKVMLYYDMSWVSANHLTAT